MRAVNMRIFMSTKFLFSSSFCSRSPLSCPKKRVFLSSQAKTIEDQFINKEFSRQQDLSYLSRLQEDLFCYSLREGFHITLIKIKVPLSIRAFLLYSKLHLYKVSFSSLLLLNISIKFCYDK